MILQFLHNLFIHSVELLSNTRKMMYDVHAWLVVKNCQVPLVCTAKTPSQLTLIFNANQEMPTWIWNHQKTSLSTLILCPASTNDNNKENHKPWRARHNTGKIFTTSKGSNTSSQTIQIPESFKRISRKKKFWLHKLNYKHKTKYWLIINLCIFEFCWCDKKKTVIWSKRVFSFEVSLSY